MRFHIILLIYLLVSNTIAYAQKGDTVRLDAATINTKALKSGTSRYLVYSKSAKEAPRSKYQLWTRRIAFIQHEGKMAIRITQEWEEGDTLFHTVTSICDKQNFQPLMQEAWWKGAGVFSFDFLSGEAVMADKPFSSSDTAVNRKRSYEAFVKAQGQYVLNWHVDLEVFSTLPFKKGTTFLINFYDPGLAAPKYQAYTVSGSSSLVGYNGQTVDCWLLTHADGYNKELFWISKKTKEVLKLEQEFNGRYRYKIKLPFSS